MKSPSSTSRSPDGHGTGELVKRRLPTVFVRVEVGRRYWETGHIHDDPQRDEPPVHMATPMQVYAPRVGFMNPEDER